MRAPITDKHLLEMMWERFPEIMKRGIEQPAQQCRTDGRCQYAIDSGAEGMGHCPPGKCCMPARQALDKMAENARELGLDYEPSAGTQVSKVWWDGEKLMAKPIPFVEFYKPAQRTWVGLTDKLIDAIYSANGGTRTRRQIYQAIEAKLKELNQ